MTLQQAIEGNEPNYMTVGVMALGKIAKILSCPFKMYPDFKM